MKKIILLFSLIASGYIHAQLPKPDHIVMVMFQNKAYSQIVGSKDAPYINSLLADTNTALFTQSYALTHPSQPNYLMLYSGSNQGVIDDKIPANTPFTTCNLGASLLASALTFTGYSESMPSAGYLGNSTTLYFRKHNPWSDWQGSRIKDLRSQDLLNNSIPPEVNQPFSSFPSNFNSLPDVSIVVPNIVNCMHDGTIQQGDDWLKSNLDGYIQWAKTHNSLFILTFDEDDNTGANNNILTFFIGQMVKSGSYNNHITHYNLLRTIEDIYELPKCGGSANNPAIDFVWNVATTTGLKEKSNFINNLNVWPVPSKGYLRININAAVASKEVGISLHDLSGRTVKEKKLNLETGENILDFEMNGLDAGVYFLNISGKEFNVNRKITIE